MSVAIPIHRELTAKDLPPEFGAFLSKYRVFTKRWLPGDGAVPMSRAYGEADAGPCVIAIEHADVAYWLSEGLWLFAIAEAIGHLVLETHWQDHDWDVARAKAVANREWVLETFGGSRWLTGVVLNDGAEMFASIFDPNGRRKYYETAERDTANNKRHIITSPG